MIDIKTFFAALAADLADLNPQVRASSLHVQGLQVWLGGSLRRGDAVIIRTAFGARGVRRNRDRIYTKDVTPAGTAKQVRRLLAADQTSRVAHQAALVVAQARWARERAVKEALDPLVDTINDRVERGPRPVSHVEADGDRPSGEVLVSLRLSDLTEAQAQAVLAVLAGPVVEPAPRTAESDLARVLDTISDAKHWR